MLRKIALCASVCTVAVSVNLTIGLAAARAQTAPQPASQDRAAQETAHLDDVVVTARRIEERLQDVPAAVTAVTGETLRELNIQSQQDLTKAAPGLQVANSGGSTRQVRFVIRGQGQSFGSGITSVPFYFAEVPGHEFSFFDLQSLQVLKGPQGTLFGATATGGALLFEPKRPGNTFSGYANFQLGDLNYKAGEAAFGGPIIEDKLMFRVAGQYRVRDGYSTAYPSFAGPRGVGSPIDFDNVDTTYWRAALTWRPTDNIENYTVYSGSHYSSNGNAQFLYYANPRYISAAVRNTVPAATPATAALYFALTGQNPPANTTWGQLVSGALARQTAIGPRTVYFDYDRHNETEFHGIVNQTRWDISDNLTVKNTYGLYWTKQRGAVLDTDASDLPVVDTVALQNPPPGGPHWNGGWPSRTWSDELQVLGTSFNDRLKWQTGFFYQRRKDREFASPATQVIVNGVFQGALQSAAQCTALGVASPCTPLNRSDNWESGLYAQGTYAILDNLNLTAGVRRSWSERKTETTAGPAVFANVSGFPILVTEDVQRIPGAGIRTSAVPLEEADTYALTLDWKVNDDTLVYATHRTGYKPGGVNVGAPAGQETFGPEDISDVEVGVKADWTFNGIITRANVAVFRDDYSDIQRRSLVPGTSSQVTSNLANGIIQGLEVEATIIPKEWFEVTGFFSLTDAEYTNWTQNSTCASEFYRPQCTGLAGTTPVVIDHSNGVLTVNGSSTSFTPNLFNSTSKYRFGIRPTLHLSPWLHEEISVSANINYRSRFSTDDTNMALFAGTSDLVTTGVGTQVKNGLIMPAYTITDLRFDWRNIHGGQVSAAAQVSNVFDEFAPNGTSGGLTIGGVVAAIPNEPRLWYFELSYAY